MSTVVVGEQDWLTEVIRERQAHGLDVFDEVWEGVYHVAPNAGTEHGMVSAEVLLALAGRAKAAGLYSSGPFNLGFRVDPVTGKKNFRVPDAGWFRTRPHGTYAETAVVVLEVLSPDDETYAKFAFYLARGVQEILVVHPTERWVECWVNAGTGYDGSGGSAVLNVTTQDLAAEIDWP